MRTPSAAYALPASGEWRGHEREQKPRFPGTRAAQSIKGRFGSQGIEKDGVLEFFYADRLQEYLVDGCEL